MAEEEDLVFVPDVDTMCNICYAEFLDVEDLNMHLKQMHKGKVPCKFCPTVFGDLDSYALHIRDTHVTKLRSCGFCSKIFINHNDLRKHESKHWKTVPKDMYKCSQCNVIAANVIQMEKHEFEEHNNDLDGIFINNVLPYLSSYLGTKAIAFIKSLNTNAKYDCRICKSESANSADYLSHLQKNECRALTCDSCGCAYPNQKSLRRHFYRCTTFIRKDSSKRKCNKCDQTILTHQWQKHVKICKPVHCRICDLRLDTIDEMTKHQSENHPMAITMAYCTFCTKEFVGKVSLQKHIDRVHKKELHLYKYKCVHCNGHVFKHPKLLFAHMFSQHHDIKPFSCHICNETFRVRKRFTLHIKLQHNSIGFIEFDENYHVHFTAKRSENPFQPKCLFTDIEKDEIKGDGSNTCDIDIDEALAEDQTDVPTDVQTDAEDNKNISKPPKMRFKSENKLKLGPKQNVKVLKGIKSKMKTRQTELDNTDFSDEEPLSTIKKQIKKENKRKRKTIYSKKMSKKSFTCNICDKYCYTYQNYNLHVASHYDNETKNCIKCSKSFLSASSLQRHMRAAHSKSKLTEHLHNLLDRKKRGIFSIQSNVPESVKFLQTIKKVKSEPIKGSATIKEVGDKLSVKNFIENFTPEERPKKKLDVEMSVTIKTLDKPIIKPPSIKMMKFTPKPIPKVVKLAMPVKYKHVATGDKPKVTVRIVQTFQSRNNNNQNDDFGDETCMEECAMSNDYDDDDNNSSSNLRNEVPEVAQEVMLESQETIQKPPIISQQKIVLPKISNKVNPNEIKIAHLLPEAPYYRITNLKEILSPKAVKDDIEQKPSTQTELTLPSGRKLVSVNPLAHLIGERAIDKLVRPSYSKYKRKAGNYEDAVIKALLDLETYKPYTKKKKGNVSHNLTEEVLDTSTQDDKNTNDGNAEEVVVDDKPETITGP